MKVLAFADKLFWNPLFPWSRSCLFREHQERQLANRGHRLGAAISDGDPHLQVDFVYQIFDSIGAIVGAFLGFADRGSEFVFGPLAKGDVSDQAFGPANSFIFAVRALPTVIFVSSVFTVLYHLRILQAIVWFFAKAMRFVFGQKGVSGAETLAATANVFMGQTEAPLIIKPYVPSMTRSELLALMIGGMATVSAESWRSLSGWGLTRLRFLRRA